MIHKGTKMNTAQQEYETAKQNLNELALKAHNAEIALRNERRNTQYWYNQAMVREAEITKLRMRLNNALADLSAYMQEVISVK